MGSYTVVGSGDLVRELDRGVQGERCCGRNLLTEWQPLGRVSGARECESREGEETDKSDVGDVDRQARRFLMEKHCSAWEKWAGRGRATLDMVLSIATGILHHVFKLLSGEEPTVKTKATQYLKCDKIVET